MISSMRPGRADITPMRSASIAASSSECVISRTVAPDLAPQPQQFVAHQEARLLVERAERLVEQDDARPLHQRARDADALAHAAGELHRIGGGELGEAHQAQRVIDARRDLGLRRASVWRRPNAMLSVTVSQGKLASSWNTTPMPSGTSPAIGLPSSVDGAVGRAVQPGDDFEQRRLSAAGRPDDREELAARQVEVDRPERHAPRACCLVAGKTRVTPRSATWTVLTVTAFSA